MRRTELGRLVPGLPENGDLGHALEGIGMIRSQAMGLGEGPAGGGDLVVGEKDLPQLKKGREVARRELQGSDELGLRVLPAPQTAIDSTEMEVGLHLRRVKSLRPQEAFLRTIDLPELEIAQSLFVRLLRLESCIHESCIDSTTATGAPQGGSLTGRRAFDRLQDRKGLLP